MDIVLLKNLETGVPADLVSLIGFGACAVQGGAG
jgi:hypothetical protein